MMTILLINIMLISISFNHEVFLMCCASTFITHIKFSLQVFCLNNMLAVSERKEKYQHTVCVRDKVKRSQDQINQKWILTVLQWVCQKKK